VTSLKAYAEVLQRKFTRSGDAQSASQLGKMNAQLDKLTNLISDLLDATKIESGKLQIEKEKFDIDHLVTEIVEEMQRTTENQKLVISGTVKKKVTADRERIGQVLTNLLSNAIKYSPADKQILISATSVAEGVQIGVQDFGVGISSEIMRRRGGTISVESKKGKGSTFRFRLPSSIM
jgi:signal transduction histidine kinase